MACNNCRKLKLKCERGEHYVCCRRCSLRRWPPDPLVPPTIPQQTFRRHMSNIMSQVCKTDENLKLELEIEQLVQRNFILWRSNPGFEQPFAHYAFLREHPELYFNVAVATFPVCMAQGTDASNASPHLRTGPKCFSRKLICDFLILEGQPLLYSDRRHDDFVWRPTIDVGDGQFIMTRMCYPQPEYGLMRIWCTSVSPTLTDKEHVSVLIQTTTAKCIYGSKQVSALQDLPETYICLSSACNLNNNS